MMYKSQKKKKKIHTYDWFLTQVNIFHLVFIFYFRKQFLIGLVYKNNPSVHSLKCNLKHKHVLTLVQVMLVLTLRLSRRMKHLKIKRLSVCSLDHRHILSCPFIGFGQSVGPPVRPVNLSSIHGDGKWMW